MGGVRARADFEIDVRRGNAHLAEENVGERFVVVLASVDQNGIDHAGMALHFADQRSDFWKIGPGAYDIDDFKRTRIHLMAGCSEKRQSGT